MGAVVVTGAAGGIGRAIADRFDGDRLALFDASQQVSTVADELDATHAEVLDVTDGAVVRTVIDEVAERFGGIDVMVNCAGTAHRTSFADTTAEEFMADVSTNMLGTFLCCQAAVFPYMEKARYGRLINIASISGKTGGTGPVHADGSGGRSGVAYASSKAGVINMTRWIAREVGRLGITSNVVAPGPIATQMTAGHAYDTSEIPAGRLGTPEEVADAVAWLATPGAGYVNGTVIDVDGGLTRA
ncbi:SDR family NAD(P)-dependent oxidoreductase [Saccharopolyspora phatthalungensis]|uniref:3-oxoacyl-[acyl-carrier protein] reductase n=1 Tax=Saccharopolyspora phatthalungensis TaxID=664693 RepID=A0A840QBE2_9PSEU|nr:SDR family NAD(P)-dependent oxidoreductase [Saccharopolyspora phatthalungensis]MBB5158074.1 3-oxoacyl-[acyl-carrier protein] reductase [Saccharopolyspora phatthalungensis]